MSTDLLLRIVLVLSSIAIIFLIVVLWRLYKVLTDVNETTTIAKKRAHDLDNWIDKIESAVGNMSETVKGILTSLESLKVVKDSIVSIIKEKTNKKGKDE